MKTRIIFALLVAGACSLVVSAQGEEPAASKAQLKKGMLAEAVLQTVGKPQEVRPMEAPEGKAEVWTYRRVHHRGTTQVATGVVEHPAFVWIAGPLGTTKEVTHSIQNVTVYQVTAVLMFNGQMVSAKQWFEREAGSYQ